MTEHHVEQSDGEFLWVVLQDGKRVAVPIAADTTEEYLELLRGALRASGRTAGKVAKYVGMPRSTAYNFASTSNHALPKDPEQLDRFLTGCKLTVPTRMSMIALWERLNEQRVPEDEILDAELVAKPGGTLVASPTKAVAPIDSRVVNTSDISDLLDRHQAGALPVDRLLHLLRQMTGPAGIGRDFVMNGDVNIVVNNATTADTPTGSSAATDTPDERVEHRAIAAGRRERNQPSTRGTAQQTLPDDPDGRPGYRHATMSHKRYRFEWFRDILGDQRRFRNLVILILLAAVIVFAFIAVLSPGQVNIAVIAIFGAMSVTAMGWLFQRSRRYEERQ